MVSGAGSLIQSGSGTTVLTGANTYSGGTTINAGTLQLGNGGTTGWIAGNVTDNGALAFNRSDNATFAGVVSGTGGLTQSGPGTLILTGNNTYSGLTTISAGTLQIGNGGTSGAITGAVADNGLLVFDRSDSVTQSGVVSGTGGLTQLGSGALVLSGANTYTGATNVIAGLLDLTGSLTGATVNVAAGASLTDANGGLAASTNLTDNGAVAINASQTIANLNGTQSAATAALALGSTLTVSGGGSFAGAITGLGRLTLSGGVETLSGTNTYTGATTIGAGALALSGAGSIADTSVAVASGATFDIGQTTAGASIVSLSGAGSVALGSQTLTLSNASGTFSGVAAGSGGLTVGGGAETLSGVNTYSGPTTINPNATLALAGSGAIVGAVTDNGVFDISQSAGATIASLSGSGLASLGAQRLTLGNASGAFSGVIAGAGGLTVAGGSEILTGANTYSGGTTINSGATLRVGAGGATGAIVGNVTDNGALVFNRSDTVTFAGAINGAGSLTQAGNGLLVLNGNNTLSGLVTVASGTLQVGDSNNASARLNAPVSGVVIDNGATLEGHGAIIGAVTNVAGGTARPGGSVGTLTVGSYTQGANSTFAVEVTPSQASELVATGTASLAGSAVATFDTGVYGSKIYPILQASSINGSFASLTRVDMPAHYVSALYQPNSQRVDLLLAPVRTAAVYGDISNQAVDAAHAFGGMLLRHLDTAGCSASGQLTTNGATMAGGDQATDCGRGRAWLQPFGSFGQTGGDASGAFSNLGAGVATGVDVRLDNDMVVGVAGEYASDRISLSGSNTSATTTTYQVGLYGLAPLGRFKLSGTGFYFDTNSTVSRDTLGFGQASASPHGRGEGAALQVAYELADPDIVPMASVHFVNYDRTAVNEANVDPLGFHIASQSTDSVRGDLGVRMQHSYDLNGIAVTPTLWLGLEQEFVATRRDASGYLTIAPVGTAFTAPTPSPDRTAAVMDLTVAARVSDRFQLYADLGGRLGAKSQQGQMVVGAQLRF